MSALVVPAPVLLDAADLAPLLDHLAGRLRPAHRYYLGEHAFPVDLEDIAAQVFQLRHDTGVYDAVARAQVVNAARSLRDHGCQCDAHMAPVVSLVIGQLHDAARRIRKVTR